MRGFKKDISATREARAKGLLSDKRSFISQPKLIEGENDAPEAHLVLYGADSTNARKHVFQRERNRCQDCHAPVTWENGELHHIRHKPWTRCSCPQNLALICRRCHQLHHAERTPKFSKAQTGLETIADNL